MRVRAWVEKMDTIADNPLCSGATAILISCRPTLEASGCLQDHTVLGAIK